MFYGVLNIKVQNGNILGEAWYALSSFFFGGGGGGGGVNSRCWGQAYEAKYPLGILPLLRFVEHSSESTISDISVSDIRSTTVDTKYSLYILVHASYNITKILCYKQWEVNFFRIFPIKFC